MKKSDFYSDSIVTIVPIRSETFFSEATQHQKVLDHQGNDTGQVKAVGPYKEQKLPLTKQREGIPWSESRGRYVFDETDIPEEKLNEFVKRCALRYKSGKNNGEIIERADPYDFLDPFFTHRDLAIEMTQGSVKLDKKKPKDFFILAGLKENQYFLFDDSDHYKRMKAKYRVQDKSASLKEKVEKNSLERKAIALFEKQSLKKKIQIAMALNLGVNDESDLEIVESVLYPVTKDTTTKIDGKTTLQDMYIYLSEMEGDELLVHYMIGKALRKGVIRESKANGYTAFGKPLGRTRESVEVFFRSPDNQNYFEMLETALTNI